MDTIRVLRVLEYVGPRESVEKTLAQNAVKIDRDFGTVQIREGRVGVPEVLPKRLERQAVVWEWGLAAFGFDQMASLAQRGTRFAEEAIELAQAAGVDRAMLHKLVDFIYDRPVGEFKQEVGGVGVTLLALCASKNVDADQCEIEEIARVLAKPIEHFHKRNAEKNAAGFFAIKGDKCPGLNDPAEIKRQAQRHGLWPSDPDAKLDYIARAQAALDAAGEPPLEGRFVGEAWVPDVVEITRFVPLDELPAPPSPFDLAKHVEPVAP